MNAHVDATQPTRNRRVPWEAQRARAQEWASVHAEIHGTRSILACAGGILPIYGWVSDDTWSDEWELFRRSRAIISPDWEPPTIQQIVRTWAKTGAGVLAPTDRPTRFAVPITLGVPCPELVSEA